MIGRQNADLADILHLRDVATATSFWLSMGYNLGCMIASDTPFDSKEGGFSGSSYRIRYDLLGCANVHPICRKPKNGCHGNVP